MTKTKLKKLFRKNWTLAKETSYHLLTPRDLSKYGFEMCLIKGKDTKKNRDYITDGEYICKYCEKIRDIKSMWRKIRNSKWAKYYCHHIKDRRELRERWDIRFKKYFD